MAGNQAFANYRSKRRAAELQRYSTPFADGSTWEDRGGARRKQRLRERAIRLHPIQHEFRQLKKQIENARQQRTAQELRVSESFS